MSVGPGGGDPAHHPALAQHDHPVRRRHHLAELVRDEDRRQPLGHRKPQGAKQRLRLARRQHRRRLVEDQDARVAVERLQDLGALALADRQVAHPSVRIHVEPEPLAERADARPRRRPPIARPPQRRGPERDVLQHRHVVGQREVLVHHAHARRERRARLAGRQRPAEDLDAARIRHVVAEEDVHQRGLAGAVLAEERDHLAAAQFEAHAVIGRQRPEALGDPVEPQDDGRVGRGRRQGQLDCGSPSSIATVKLPSRIPACRSATSSSALCGTCPSKDPSGAMDEPPARMKE